MCLLNDMVSLKTDVNVPVPVPKVINKQKNLEKKTLFCWHLESLCLKEQDLDPGRICIPVYGSKDPDPHQNVTDPEHW